MGLQQPGRTRAPPLESRPMKLSGTWPLARGQVAPSRRHQVHELRLPSAVLVPGCCTASFMARSRPSQPVAHADQRILTVVTPERSSFAAVTVGTATCSDLARSGRGSCRSSCLGRAPASSDLGSSRSPGRILDSRGEHGGACRAPTMAASRSIWRALDICSLLAQLDSSGAWIDFEAPQRDFPAHAFRAASTTLRPP